MPGHLLISISVAMATLFADETADKVVDKCLRLFGGHGYLMEYPIATMYPGSRVSHSYGGTSELMREIISRSR